jgi:hypothetical protein
VGVVYKGWGVVKKNYIQVVECGITKKIPNKTCINLKSIPN